MRCSGIWRILYNMVSLGDIFLFKTPRPILLLAKIDKTIS